MMVLASIAPMNLTGSHWGQILFEVNFELLYAIDFNPKRHGLFGLPDTWGGLIQSILEKRSVTPPNFILEQQTESYMKADIFF